MFCVSLQIARVGGIHGTWVKYYLCAMYKNIIIKAICHMTASCTQSIPIKVKSAQLTVCMAFNSWKQKVSYKQKSALLVSISKNLFINLVNMQLHF